MSRLKRLAFELDPSLKGNAASKGSLIPTLDAKKPEESNWNSQVSVDDDESEESNWNPTAVEPTTTSKKKAIDFEDEL